MSIQIALLLALVASSAAAPDLCPGMSSQIEPDMQIVQTDLDHAAASAAVDTLRTMLAQGRLTGEFQFGALNQLKIIQGHLLLQQALADRAEFGAGSMEAGASTDVFCRWLETEGFWYD